MAHIAEPVEMDNPRNGVTVYENGVVIEEIEDDVPNGTLPQDNHVPEEKANEILETNHKDSTPESFLSHELPELKNLKDFPVDKIFNECSLTAQEIKKHICSVLKSREDSTVVIGTVVETPNFDDSIKQKIAEMEQVIQKTSAESASSLKSTENTPKPSLLDLDDDISNEADELSSLSNASTSNSSSAPLVEQLSTDSGVNEQEEFKATETLLEEKVAITGSSENLTSLPQIDKQRVAVKKQSRKKGTGSRNKEEKTVDHVMKGLANIESDEEKMNVLCQKYLKALEDQKILEASLKQTDKQMNQIVREKEHLQSSHNRTVLAKSRLESLCHELQRQNRALKEESILKIREEDEKRKSVIAKFQTTLNDITSLMQDNQQRNDQLKNENAELAQKLKTLLEHYDMWEKHMEKVVRQKEIEIQLLRAKASKVTLDYQHDKEIFLTEKKDLLLKLQEFQKQNSELVTTEIKLRQELHVYNTKYEEFHGVLDKSNAIFDSFKQDMEKMSKKIKKLEKETGQWRSRWENSNRALLEMATDKQKRDAELIQAQQRLLTLEKLCRAMQTERAELLKKLNGENQNGESNEGSTSTTSETPS